MPGPRKPRAPRASPVMKRVDYIADQKSETPVDLSQTSAVEVSNPEGGDVLQINVIDYSKVPA